MNIENKTNCLQQYLVLTVHTKNTKKSYFFSYVPHSETFGCLIINFMRLNYDQWLTVELMQWFCRFSRKKRFK